MSKKQEPKVAEQKAEEKAEAAAPKDPKVEAEQKIGELTEMLQRLTAEFQNYKKRADAERCEFIKYAHAGLIIKILPIIDSFEMAIKNTGKHEDFVKGVELIYAQLFDVLEKEGISRIEARDKKFDHNLHEVMMVVEGEEDDRVVEELQPGYLLNGRVLRPSKVKISKKGVQK